MEDLVAPDPAFWRDRRVLVTGHTGFKGAWLSLWLHELGAHVTGFALPPETQPSLFGAAGLEGMLEHHVGDIREAATLNELLRSSRPEVVFHLAAQSLVRRSYEDPAGTFLTNLAGTANVLEAMRLEKGVRAAVIVTSDKCYDNRGTGRPFREDDPLGGSDPYSSSKGCAELITIAMRGSFFTAEGATAVATARAGNVIGGGDWADDRLIPDIERAVHAGQSVRIRNPAAVRPWQHVLEPLRGYLLLAESLCSGGQRFARSWNFGPSNADAVPVADVVDRALELWNAAASWQRDAKGGAPESSHLSLDASLAAENLGWRPRLPLAEALAWTVGWYRGFRAGESARDLTLAQVRRYARLPEMA
ncbi:MAG: CDP-glucose 4,6-dehydratase [Candidatus Parcubacteria bacterium]|nr:CDP-glucose 4,6-dehydratase [Burkholderiales bacterium]